MKIRTFDTKRVTMEDIELVVSENEDGNWDLCIKEHGDKRLRIGVPNDGGTYFKFWREISAALRGPSKENK